MIHRYSLIKAKKKPIVSIFSKIWLTLIAAIFLALLAINFFLVFKNNSMKSQISTLNQYQSKTAQEIASLDEINDKFSKQRARAGEIFASNAILKQSLNNLFDLIPDDITLSEVTMSKNSLVIKGVAPNKDSYNALLLAPLRSIFASSETSFEGRNDGRLNFISTNKIDKSEGYNE